MLFRSANTINWPYKRRRRLGPINLRRRFWKRQRVDLITVRGCHFKRLVLPDTRRAVAIQHTLEAFGHSPHVPTLAMRRHREIWVEYIEGTIPDEPTSEAVHRVAELFTVFYTRRPYQADITETPYPSRLRNDLWVLHRLGAIDEGLYESLVEAGWQLAPSRIWLGFDYVDPDLRNFVFAATHHQACAVDVEAIVGDSMLGLGLTQAKLGWLEPFWETFLDSLVSSNVPDLRAYWDFVELCYLAKRFKRQLLTGKLKSLELHHLDQLRSKLDSTSRTRTSDRNGSRQRVEKGN